MSALAREVRLGKAAGDDLSVHAFMESHFGTQFADIFAVALMRGIYAGDAHTLSARSTLGAMVEMADRHGSLLSAYVAEKTVREPVPMIAAADRLDLASVRPVSFQSGMHALVAALDAFLEKADSVEVRRGTRVAALVEERNGVAVQLGSGNERSNDGGSFQAVICCVPAPEASSLLSGVAPDAADAAAQIQCLSVGVVNLVYAAGKLNRGNLTGFGMLTGSQSDAGPILGVVFDSDVFPEQDAGMDVERFTVMLGGRDHQDWLEAVPETEVAARALAEFERVVLGDGGGTAATDLPAPLHVEAVVWRRAIPQYDVGHARLVARVKEAVNGTRTGVLGNSFHGVGINDCVAAAAAYVDRMTMSDDGGDVILPRGQGAFDRVAVERAPRAGGILLAAALRRWAEIVLAILVCLAVVAWWWM